MPEPGEIEINFATFRYLLQKKWNTEEGHGKGREARISTISPKVADTRNLFFFFFGFRIDLQGLGSQNYIHIKHNSSENTLQLLKKENSIDGHRQRRYAYCSQLSGSSRRR